MTEGTSSKQDRLRGFQEQVASLADRLRKEVVHLSRMGRAKLDILGFRREMNRILLRLGKRTHELLKEGNVVHEELEALSKRVADLEKEVGKVEQGLQTLKEGRKALSVKKAG